MNLWSPKWIFALFVFVAAGCGDENSPEPAAPSAAERSLAEVKRLESELSKDWVNLNQVSRVNWEGFEDHEISALRVRLQVYLKKVNRALAVRAEKGENRFKGKSEILRKQALAKQIVKQAESQLQRRKKEHADRERMAEKAKSIMPKSQRLKKRALSLRKRLEYTAEALNSHYVSLDSVSLIARTVLSLQRESHRQKVRGLLEQYTSDYAEYLKAVQRWTEVSHVLAKHERPTYYSHFFETEMKLSDRRLSLWNRSALEYLDLFPAPEASEEESFDLAAEE